MTNLVGVPGWDEVVQLETNTIAQGGPGGPMNSQAQALLNRLAALDSENAGLGAEKVARAVFRVETVAALRALPAPTRKTVVYLEGYYAQGDSTQGALVWMPTSNKADNGGTVFIPDSAPANGRWERGPFGMTTAWFGVKGDGVADDTVTAQAAVTAARAQGGDKRTLIWTKGTNKITNFINIGTNQHIVFEPGVTIDATGLPNETTSAFNINGQSNVYMEGNGATVLGARATAGAGVEGNSAGFFIYGSDNVLIRDFLVKDFATDGITVTGDNGASGPCTNVRIEGCDCHNNRRNGLSIIHAIGAVVTGGRYWGSNGAPSGPWAGIDVEPNSNNVAHNILIQGVRTQANAGAGILIVPSAQSVTAGTHFDVRVEAWHSEEDGAVNSTAALLFASGGTWTNEVLGQVVIDGAVINNSKANGVGFQNWDADKAPRAILRDVTVINPDGQSNASNTNEHRTGFVVYTTSAMAVSNQGNIVFENCKAEDTRGTPRMPWGFLLDADSGKTLKNIRVRNPQSVNFVAVSKFDVNVEAALDGGCSDVDVTYDSPRLVTAITSAAIGAWVGKRITAQTGGNAFTLPALSKSIGAHYELFAPSSLGSNVSFVGQVGENIKANGVAAANTLVVAPGDCWRVWNPNGLQWVARPHS